MRTRHKVLPKAAALSVGVISALLVIATSAIATAPAAAKVVGETIYLGASLSLTGIYRLSGNHTKRGYDFAIERINAKGGVSIGGKRYQLKAIYYDDESREDRGAVMAERLITQDGVKFMLGPYSSGLTEAVAEVTEKYKVPMVEANGASRALFTKGYEYLFAVLSTSEQYLKEAVSLSAAQARRDGRAPAGVKVAIAVEPDPFSMDVRAGILEDANGYGMQVVIDDRLPRKLNTMIDTLNKVRRAKPDLLVVSGHAEGAALAIRQVGEMRIDVPMIALTHCEAAAVHKKFPQAAENVLCATQWAETMEYQDSWFGSASEFADEFESQYGYLPPYQAAESAAAVLVYADALRRAGSFAPNRVRDAIAATDMETFYGRIKFDSTGKNTAKPMVLRQIQNGTYVAVAPEGAAKGKLVYPRPAM